MSLQDQYEAAERVAMRRWLRRRCVEPAMGQKPETTKALERQVETAGGDPAMLKAVGRATVDARLHEMPWLL